MPAGQVQPTVAHVPWVVWLDVGAQGMPSEVAEQPAMAVIPLPTTGRMGLPTALVAPTVAGVTQPVGAPPTQVEAATGGPQPGATVAASEAPARPAPSAAQATTPGVGQTQGDAAEGSPGVVVLGERSASAPLTPSVAVVGP